MERSTEFSNDHVGDFKPWDGDTYHALESELR